MGIFKYLEQKHNVENLLMVSSNNKSSLEMSVCGKIGMGWFDEDVIVYQTALMKIVLNIQRT